MIKSQPRDIHCDCGKLVARERDGVIYVWCKECRKEVAVKVIHTDK